MRGTQQPRSRMRRMSARPSWASGSPSALGKRRSRIGSVLEAALGLARAERGLDLIAGDFEELLTEVELYGVVVNDENTGHLGACLS